MVTRCKSGSASGRLSLLTLSLMSYCFVTVDTTAAGTETLIGITGQDFVLLAADSSVASGGSIALTGTNLDKIAVLSLSRPIAAAAAGNAADADRLLGVLTARCTIAEYETSFGQHVTFVDCSNDAGSSGATTSIPRYGEDSGLTVECVAEAARTEIAGRFNVCLLIAGMTPATQTVSSSSASDLLQGQVSTAAAFFRGTKADDLIKQEKENSSRKSSKLQPALYWLDEYGSLQRVSYGAHGYASSMLWSVLDRGFRPGMTLEEAIALLDKCLEQLRARYLINSQPETDVSKPPQFCVKCIDENGCRLIVR